jgi:hypothetical protein
LRLRRRWGCSRKKAIGGCRAEGVLCRPRVAIRNLSFVAMDIVMERILEIFVLADMP